MESPGHAVKGADASSPGTMKLRMMVGPRKPPRKVQHYQFRNHIFLRDKMGTFRYLAATPRCSLASVK